MGCGATMPDAAADVNRHVRVIRMRRARVGRIDADLGAAHRQTALAERAPWGP